MKTQAKRSCRKVEYQKVSFDLKLSTIDQINNGQISTNYAAHEYGISRSSIDYWRKKLSNFESKSNAMNLIKEIEKKRLNL